MKTTRYTIDLDQTFDDSLSGMALKKGISKAEIIKRALATYKYITSQASDEEGRKVSITDNQDKVLKDVVIP